MLDLEPRGPLSPEIYRRRRALAIGVAGLVAAIVIGTLFMVFGGGSPGTPKKAAEPNTSQGPLGQAPDPGVKTPV
ncbi:MAG: hypothetical protein KDB72_24405, partial [Mycobacterium sp.]|nr:hypothetical protein [Mycobacterium sp.]